MVSQGGILETSVRVYSDLPGQVSAAGCCDVATGRENNRRYEVVFNLLIIYSDGTEKIVNDVTDYSFDIEIHCFVYKKNGYRSFVPVGAVRFFGREFDYNNKPIGKRS